MNVVDFVTWSTRCVYFVLDDRPKFFTCITFGSTWRKEGMRRDLFVSKSITDQKTHCFVKSIL